LCSNWILGWDFLPNRSKIAQPARLKFLDHLKSGLTSQNPNKLEKGNPQKLVSPFFGRDCYLGEAPPKSVVNPGNLGLSHQSVNSCPIVIGTRDQNYHPKKVNHHVMKGMRVGMYGIAFLEGVFPHQLLGMVLVS